MVDVQLGGIIDELQEAIRRELGADHVPLNGGPVTGGTAAPSARGKQPAGGERGAGQPFSAPSSPLSDITSA